MNSGRTISHKDFEALSDAPAVMKFWIRQKDIPDTIRREGVRLLADRSGMLPLDVLLTKAFL